MRTSAPSSPQSNPARCPSRVEARVRPHSGRFAESRDRAGSRDPDSTAERGTWTSAPSSRRSNRARYPLRIRALNLGRRVGLAPGRGGAHLAVLAVEAVELASHLDAAALTSRCLPSMPWPDVATVQVASPLPRRGGAHLAVLAVKSVELASRFDAAALTSRCLPSMSWPSRWPRRSTRRHSPRKPRGACCRMPLPWGAGLRVFISSVPRVSRDPRPKKREHPQDPRRRSR